jgi:hypothetical protein
MKMSDLVADHSPDEVHAHMLKCQGVDRFRHWDATRRPAIIRDFLRQQPEGSLFGLSDWLIAMSEDPGFYL